jgi:hypothetical protein
MSGSEHEKLRNEIESLASRIRSRIDAHGICVIKEDELNLVWDHHGTGTDLEKRMRVENFACHHGFTVHLSGNSTVAVFRNSNQFRAHG